MPPCWPSGAWLPGRAAELRLADLEASDLEAYIGEQTVWHDPSSVSTSGPSSFATACLRRRQRVWKHCGDRQGRRAADWAREMSVTPWLPHQAVGRAATMRHRLRRSPEKSLASLACRSPRRIPGDDRPDHASPDLEGWNQIQRDRDGEVAQPLPSLGEAVVIAQHVHQNVNSQPAANSPPTTPMIQRKITMPEFQPVLHTIIAMRSSSSTPKKPSAAITVHLTIRMPRHRQRASRACRCTSRSTAAGHQQQQDDPAEDQHPRRFPYQAQRREFG